MPILGVILVLALLYELYRLALAAFRRGFKTGQVVGVRFGEEIVNRTVVNRSRSIACVLDAKAEDNCFVRLNRIYMRHPYEETDQPVGE